MAYRPFISNYQWGWEMAVSQFVWRCGCRRQGRQEVAVTVEVEPEGEKEHHELAKPLADLLGMKHESRANILQALFTYIRLHKLQVGQLFARC